MIDGVAEIRKTALLVEGAFVGSRWCPRPNSGALNAGQLYHRLMRPRFREIVNGAADYQNSCDVLETTAQSKVADAASEETPEPDAEQRIIYVTDLDPNHVLALIMTVSYHEAEGLRNALCRHLASDPYAGLTISKSGLPMFELAFHLPFKALQAFHEGETTKRIWRDVSFLNSDDETPEYIFSETCSFVIIGPDRWRWVAYWFGGTAHDLCLVDDEPIEDWSEDLQGLTGTCGQYFTSLMDRNREPNPRDYFLRVLEMRLSLIADEWGNIIMKIQRSTDAYKKVC